jgi:CubicO group peptidase (beta-lactamase class C family)
VRNFTDAPDGLNEQAARFSVVEAGETIVDLWAGAADPREGTPFTERTLVPVFSTGKAVMALLVAYAVQRGKLA